MAYANVHGTDFQVPTRTAAFWAPTSSEHYPVVVDDDEHEDDHSSIPDNIVMKLTTPRNDSILPIRSEDDDDDDFSGMSRRLDAMGWTKVLVDVRPHLPSLSRKKKNAEQRLLDNNDNVTPLTARQLLERFGGGQLLSIPLGHTVMVANAKDGLNRWLTQGGKPIMDYLAKTMIEGLLETMEDDDEEQE
jgi:hypothetical protein